MHQALLCEFQRELKFGFEDKKVGVEIQKMLCEGRNTDNLIESICFYLKISRVHMFCLNCIRVWMCFAMKIVQN